MPLAVPAPQAAWQHNLPATPSSSAPGTTVTGSGSANTKGSYSSLIDPVTYTSTMLCLLVKGTAAATTRTDALLDIAIGPSGGGSEQIILPDLLVGWRAADNDCVGGISIPFLIPRGVRVSARAQGVQVSKTVDVICYLMGGTGAGAWPTFSGCDAYGITSSGASNGTSITPGASGTEGSWTNVGSTTSRIYRGLMLVMQGNLADTSLTNDMYHFEVGVSSGTEIFGEWWAQGTTAEDAYTFPSMPLWRAIPSGVQLQVRAESGSATVEPHDVGLYLFY